MTTLATRLEEVQHKLTALVFKDTTDDFCLRVHRPRSVFVVATLLVGRAIDDTWDLRPADGTRTHRTGLDSNVEGTLRQVFPTKGIGSSGDGLHLGMGGDIAEGLRQVVGP